MDKVYEEIGKGLITLGNIVAALVFLKAYVENAAPLFLALGTGVLLVLYTIGAGFILKSTRIRS